ncbi:MAG: hemerythrin domain-containing protein [Bacteroidota bacterium]
MNAIKILLDEHELLLQAIDTTKQIQAIEDNKQYHLIMNDVILFFRNFSEIYHHPKEEEMFYPLLFKYAANINPDFLHEIYDNHEDFKSLMADIENAYILYDYKFLREMIDRYLAYLEEHIVKENKLIKYVSGKLLEEEDLTSMYESFKELDNKYGGKGEIIEKFYKINLQLA